MTNPPTILAATDFSDDAGHAARRAALLAAASGTSLVLLHVVARSLLAELQDLFGGAERTEAALAAEAQRRLDALAAGLASSAGGRVAAKVAVGRVHDEVVAACAGAGLLVVGAHGMSPLRDLIVGTTAERLLRRAPCPVLVVRGAPAGPYRRVVVPVDFSAPSRVALERAGQLAPEASITVVHAWDAPYDGKLWLAGIPDAELRRHRDAARRQALAQLGTLPGAGDPRRLPPVVERDDPARLILETAKAHGADLIAIGRMGQSAVEEFMLGSVARHVLADAACDVLVATDRRPGAA